MTLYDISIIPAHFNAIRGGFRTFEVRKNDRDYKAGDVLRLRECGDGGYTGRITMAVVTYVLTSRDFPEGIMEGYAVLAIGGG